MKKTRPLRPLRRHEIYVKDCMGGEYVLDVRSKRLIACNPEDIFIVEEELKEE